MARSEPAPHRGRSAVSTAAAAGPRSRKYLVDVTVPSQAPDAFDRLRRSWDRQVGDAVPIPPSKPVIDGDYRIRVHHSKVGDAVMEDLFSEQIVGGTGGTFNHLNDRVVLYVVRRGTWRFARASGRGDTVVAPAGRFVARYNDPSWSFEIGSRTASQVLILPANDFRDLIGDGHISGSGDAPSLQMLMAHVDTVNSCLDELSPAGVEAARNALMELVKGALRAQIDEAEPLLAPALVGAARSVLAGLLTEADLSPELLARELHVSVRTLHRAFAAEGEPVMAYVRRQRLDGALRDLARSRLTVTEAAARWAFSDSSHLIRACRQQYGQTPAEYARNLGRVS